MPSLWFKAYGAYQGKRGGQGENHGQAKHIAKPKKLLIKNSFIFKICATYLKISRAKGANIGKLILFAKHAIENIFYVGTKTKHQKFPFIVFFA